MLRSVGASAESSSELLNHPAEVRLRVRAPAFGALAAEAGRALGKLLLATTPRSDAGSWRPIEIHAPDAEALLVDWLNELIYLAETERWIPVEFRVRATSDTTLVVDARGVTVEEAPTRVKAATFHGLHIGHTPGGLQAEIIFDV
jgi:SHS2 domain-containing protein